MEENAVVSPRERSSERAGVENARSTEDLLVLEREREKRSRASIPPNERTNEGVVVESGDPSGNKGTDETDLYIRCRIEKSFNVRQRAAGKRKHREERRRKTRPGGHSRTPCNGRTGVRSERPQ